MWSFALVLGGCTFDVGGVGDDGGSTTIDARPTIDSLPIPDAWRPIDANLDQPGVLTSTSTIGGLTMDGNPDDWIAAKWITFDVADADLRANCIGGYTDSISVRFASMHDNTFIYFFLSVTDDLLITDSAELYDDDAVVLYLDAAGDKSGAYGWDDHKVGLSDGLWKDYAADASPIGLTGNYTTTDAGFNFEIRIRKNSLGATPLGSQLGFDLMLSDDDTWGETDCWGYWFIAPGPHCGTCCDGGGNYPGCDTTTLGSLVLL